MPKLCHRYERLITRDDPDYVQPIPIPKPTQNNISLKHAPFRLQNTPRVHVPSLSYKIKLLYSVYAAAVVVPGKCNDPELRPVPTAAVPGADPRAADYILLKY